MSVQDGIIQYLSVSQVATFDVEQPGGCERKWWFEKVAGLERVQKFEQTLGIEVHGQIEHFLKTGENVLGSIARAGVHFLPAPKSVDVEVDFKPGDLVAQGPDHGPIPFKGRIDCVNWSESWLDDEGVAHRDPPGTVELVDWKTTSDLQWAKTGHELLQTVQMPGYAKWAETYVAEHFRLSHGYFVTRGRPAASKRSARFSLDQVNERWQAIEGVVRRMWQVALAEKSDDVEPNWSACSAYRGCSYRHLCPRSPEQTITEIFGKPNGGGSSMSLLSTLTKKPAAAPSTSKASIEAEIAKLEAKEKVGMITGPAVQALVPDAPKGSGLLGVLPPDAPKSGESARLAEPLEVPAPTPAIAAAAEAVEKKRGRPKKVVGEAPPAPVMVMETAPTPATPQGLMIYVDCVVEFQGAVVVQSLDPYVEALLRNLESQFGAADIRCAPADGPLGFGKWKGALAACARANPPHSGAYSVMGVRESEIKQVVVEALKPRCNIFVRGVS